MLPNDADDLQQGFLRVAEESVLQAYIFAKSSAHKSGRFGGFAVAYIGIAAGTQFATREVEQARRFALVNVTQEGSGGAEFHIVGVNAYGKDVYFHGEEIERFQTNEVQKWFSRQKYVMRRTISALVILLLVGALLWACENRRSYRQGESLYKTHCASCHIDDGLGLRGVIPPLAGSDYLARDPTRTACIIRNGLQGEIIVNGITYKEPMAAIPQLSDFQIANIINYINSAWGNELGYVSVPEIRKRLEECGER